MEEIVRERYLQGYYQDKKILEEKLINSNSWEREIIENKIRQIDRILERFKEAPEGEEN